MGRAKGKKLAKKDRWLHTAKDGLQDGWHTYVGPRADLLGLRALVRFIRPGTGVLVQFNHLPDRTVPLGPGWHQFHQDDFMRSDTYDKLCAAAGADVHDASGKRGNRAPRAAGTPQPKVATTRRRGTPK